MNLAAWVRSLPEGEPPEAPYVVGTTLHLPGGVRVPVDGADVAIIGATPRGTMLLVEGTGYVWVAPDGTTSTQPRSRWAGVQDAAVSPDGRWFARGREVVDLTDGSVVAAIPDGAAVILGWTRDGLVYDTRDGRTFVWQPGERGPGTRRPAISVRPVVGPPPTVQPAATYWVSDRVVLVALPEAVLRCDARTATCERALDTAAGLPAPAG